MRDTSCSQGQAFVPLTPVPNLPGSPAVPSSKSDALSALPGENGVWRQEATTAEDPSPSEPHLQAVPLLLLKTLSDIVSSC